MNTSINVITVIAGVDGNNFSEFSYLTYLDHNLNLKVFKTTFKNIFPKLHLNIRKSKYFAVNCKSKIDFNLLTISKKNSPNFVSRVDNKSPYVGQVSTSHCFCDIIYPQLEK